MVAGKLDPTVGQICFRRIFQTVRNLGKGTTGMGSLNTIVQRVQKWREGGMGWPRMSGK